MVCNQNVVFPLLDLIGKRPQSSVYSLLIVVSYRCTLFAVALVCCGAGACSFTMGGLALVDFTPCFFYVMCPLMVSVACGKYLEALE